MNTDEIAGIEMKTDGIAGIEMKTDGIAEIETRTGETVVMMMIDTVDATEIVI